MKEMFIFATSTDYIIRGSKQPVPFKAGFFYVSVNSGYPVLISSGPSLPNPKKGNWPAKVDLLTAVFGGSLFLSADQTSTDPNNVTSRKLCASTEATQNQSIKTEQKRRCISKERRRLFIGFAKIQRRYCNASPGYNPAPAHFAPIPAHLSPAISTQQATYSVSFIS